MRHKVASAGTTKATLKRPLPSPTAADHGNEADIADVHFVDDSVDRQVYAVDAPLYRVLLNRHTRMCLNGVDYRVIVNPFTVKNVALKLRPIVGRCLMPVFDTDNDTVDVGVCT